MSKYARLDSMIVTILFFASFSVKRYLHHHFSGLFGGIITDFYFYRFTNDFCVTLSVTTLKIIFLVLFSSVWGHFGIFLGRLWCEVLYFLKIVQYYFHGIVLQIFETLWPYFMNWIQLFQGYRATTMEKVTLNHKFTGRPWSLYYSDGLSIT